MMHLAIAAISLASVQPLVEPLQATATVPGMRVYVTAHAPNTEPTPELLRCAESLKQALTPSLSTLVPAERRLDADLTVELRRCEIDTVAKVYAIDWTLSFGDHSEDHQLRRTLTRARTDDWQMHATTKDLAQHLLRKVEARRR
jgi:hypothetical protein